MFGSKKVIFIFVILIIVGCATMGFEFDNVRKTQQLRPGMHYDEVANILGPPRSSQFKEGQWFVRWSLHEAWKGFVPYDMVFDPASKKLLRWGANEKEYQKGQEEMKTLAEAIGSGGGNPAPGNIPTGPNDVNLQRQIAGTWWGYAGSTERMIGLCADGTYRDYSESSYSGRSFDQYGSQTMAWGTAGQRGGTGKWTINGNTQLGTIYVTYSNGQSTTLRYKQINNPGCLSFNGHTICRRSASCE